MGITVIETDLECLKMLYAQILAIGIQFMYTL